MEKKQLIVCCICGKRNGECIRVIDVIQIIYERERNFLPHLTGLSHVLPEKDSLSLTRE